MAEATEVLRPDDPRWDAWVERAPCDFHHGAAYHAFSERMGEGRAHLVVHGNPGRFLAWPYLVAPIPAAPGRARPLAPRSDATSVYGYAGPVGLGLGEADFLARAWAACRAAWREQGLVALFTRFHPLLANHLGCEALRGASSPQGPELLRLGRSASIDLGPARDERQRAYPKVLRQEIRAAARAGLVVERDRDWRHYEAFAELYRATMAKNRSEQRYRFSREYFEGLREALGAGGHLALARRGGELAAGLLFTVHGDIAQAHLTGVDTLFRAVSPLKALIDGTADLARELGARVLHLGAGRGGREDSLFEFKSRFASRFHDFVLGRWVLDAEAYAELARDAGAAPDSGFFPAYRAERPSVGGAR